MKAKDKYVLPFLTVLQGGENVLFVLCIRGCMKRRNTGGTVKYSSDKLMEGFNLIGHGRGYSSGYHKTSTGNHFLKCGTGISCRKRLLNLTAIHQSDNFLESHCNTVSISYILMILCYTERMFLIVCMCCTWQIQILNKKYQWTIVPFEDK